ncbi:hypothetical protein BH11PSE14_BH11PSE14_10560 [soil metagenome]
MADTLRPASMLIGAVCLWAVSVLLLALAGLGSRVSESGLVAVPPPIPKVSLVATPSRLGPLPDYAQVGQRPLLNQDRRESLAPAADGGTDELDVVLTSVLITPRLQMAILTDAKDASTRRVKVGENVEGSNWHLARLEPRLAVLEGPAGQRSLVLRVYDGQGGSPPTVLGVSPAAQAANGAANGAANAQPVAGSDSSGDAADAARGSIAASVTPEAARPPVATNSVRPIQPAPAATQPAPASQDAQIEAIRRRIEARRAQMRAEAQSAGSQDH